MKKIIIIVTLLFSTILVAQDKTPKIIVDDFFSHRVNSFAIPEGRI